MGAMSVPERSEKLRKLLLSGRQYKLPKGQIVLSTDGRKVVNLIVSGYVKRYLIANDGTLGVQVLYGPGDIFPLTLIFQTLLNQDIYEGPEVFYYETMSTCEMYTLDVTTFAENVEKDPTLYKDLLSESGRRLHSTLQGLENLTLKHSYKRLAHQLAYFAHRFGESKGTSLVIKVPLTHQDLANILSVTRETVSSSIVQLRGKGLIKAGKNIVVPDIEKLEKEAYS